MNETTKSVATETPESEKQAGVESTQDETLESLLNQYDEETKEPVKPEQPKQDDVTAMRDELRQIRQERETERTQSDLEAAAKKIRGGVTAFNINETIGWLEAQAKEEPKVLDAFLKRKTAPKTWEKFVDALGPEFQKKFSATVDERVTNDREIVSAAVRGASTHAPEPEEKSVSELRDMPQGEKDKYLASLAKRYGSG